MDVSGQGHVATAVRGKGKNPGTLVHKAGWVSVPVGKDRTEGHRVSEHLWVTYFPNHK